MRAAAIPGALPLQLSEAQHAIATEYGFASWPRMVHYFAEFHRQTPPYEPGESSTLPDAAESQANWLLAEHGRGSESAIRMFAAFVPRFFGRTLQDVRAATVTIDDARMATARQRHHASWDGYVSALNAKAAKPEPTGWERHSSPLSMAMRAMKAADLPALQSIVDAHPEIVDPSLRLVANAVIIERQGQSDAQRAITDWVVERCGGLQLVLDSQLLGWHGMRPADVSFLLERGANPRWIAPNGAATLDHALVRYWNGESVDVLAAQARPRRALWIAAGLDDVSGVERFLNVKGEPKAEAWRDRPNFGLMFGGAALPSLPDPDGAEILAEAMVVAALNGRANTIRLLHECGISADLHGWGAMPILCLAAGNQMLSAVEALIAVGANAEIKGRWPESSARQLATQRWLSNRSDPTASRIVALCGGPAPDVMAEHEMEKTAEPRFADVCAEVVALAGDDAKRAGATAIDVEHLFIGLLRHGEGGITAFLMHAGTDVPRLRTALAPRLHLSSDRVPDPATKFTRETAAVVESTKTLWGKRQLWITPLHLLAAVAESDTGFVATTLTATGCSLSELRRQLARR